MKKSHRIEKSRQVIGKIISDKHKFRTDSKERSRMGFRSYMKGLSLLNCFTLKSNSYETNFSRRLRFVKTGWEVHVC